MQEDENIMKLLCRHLYSHIRIRTPTHTLLHIKHKTLIWPHVFCRSLNVVVFFWKCGWFLALVTNQPNQLLGRIHPFYIHKFF